ncbi:hypothetical protein D3C77_267170 [compost metagenome]
MSCSLNSCLSKTASAFLRTSSASMWASWKSRKGFCPASNVFMVLSMTSADLRIVAAYKGAPTAPVKASPIKMESSTSCQSARPWLICAPIMLPSNATDVATPFTAASAAATCLAEAPALARRSAARIILVDVFSAFRVPAAAPKPRTAVASTMLPAIKPAAPGQPACIAEVVR